MPFTPAILSLSKTLSRNSETMFDTSFSCRIKSNATWESVTRGVCLLVMAGLLVAVVSGCDTPYTHRVRQLDDTYQAGDLSRDDYMRFAHEEEQWNPGHTSNAFWSK